MKLFCTFALFLIFASGCAIGPPLEVNPKTVAKKGCDVKSGWGNLDVNNCLSWIDVTTPNDRVGLCRNIWGRNFRVNKYIFETSKEIPRGGPYKYNEVKSRLSCGDNGRTFRRKSAPVIGEYYMGRFLDSTVTVGDNVCGEKPDIFIYTDGRSQLMSVFQRFWKQKYKPKDSNGYRDDSYYLVNGVTEKLSNRLLTSDRDGKTITPMHQTYIRAAGVIETQCGRFPKSIKITGRIPTSIDQDASRGPVTYQTVYSGTLLIKTDETKMARNFKFGAPIDFFPSTKVAHDNEFRAAKVKAEAKIALDIQGEARFAAEVSRIQKEEKMAKGAAYLFILMNALRKNSPCFDDELSAADKSMAGCGY